jgi:hypothetical protein
VKDISADPLAVMLNFSPLVNDKSAVYPYEYDFPLILPLPLTKSPFNSSDDDPEVETSHVALTDNGNGLLNDSVYPALTTMVLEMNELSS